MKFPRLLLFSAVLCLLQYVQGKKSGHCVMYGECDKDPKTKLPRSCVDDKPPRPMGNSSIDIFQELCPSLVPSSGDPLTCCADFQVSVLKLQLDALATLFKRCPSCYHNIVNVFCQMVCSPQQSNFIQVTNTTSAQGGKKTVTGMSYFITDYYAESLFNSCKNVQMSYTTMRAITVSCGPYGSQCNPYKWLEYMGGHDPSPYEITFHFLKKDNVTVNGTVYYSMNDTIIPCSEPATTGGVACSCVDCPCTPVPPPPPEEPWTVWTLPGMWIVMIFVYGLSCIIFGTAVIIYNYFKEKDDDDELLLDADENALLKPKQQKPTFLEHIGAVMEERLQQFFTKWGVFCASNPFTVLLCGLISIVILSCGLIFFKVQANPVELWSASDSVARQEKDYFDKHFGPFYRTEQVIVVRNGGTPVHGKNITLSGVFDRDFLHQILQMQNDISNLTAQNGNKTVTFEDICFAPVNERSCMIQSVVNWFQSNASHLDFYNNDDYLQFINNCTKNPLLVRNEGLSCLGEYGGPIFPYVALGGVQNEDYLNASALILTFMVNNYNSEEENSDALVWEAKFVEYMKNFDNSNMTVAFSSERSIQDELDRESRSDVKTILISYIVMFLYVSLTLGRFTSFQSLLKKSKITLGLSGVLIVLASVLCSLGVFSYIGVPATLIIVEVIPFLVLAVGVDNIFILVQSYQRTKRHELESREEHIGRVFGQVAPSLLLASLSESFCFFLGALSSMPAVHVFALYSGLALLIDFLLQITCFVALLSLDAKREEEHRFDIFCCYKRVDLDSLDKRPGFLYNLFSKYYAPFLLETPIRVAVMLIFFGWVCSSIAVVNQIDIGLDQKLSMPQDSYVLKYFHKLEEYLSVGPPVYFVVKSGFNYSNVEDQSALCSVAYCYRESLLTQVSDAAEFSNRTYIAHPPMDWIDSYFSWTNDETSCCKVYINDSSKFCPATEKPSVCQGCQVSNDKNYRPYPEKFNTFLLDFLSENPTPQCPAGGHAAFAQTLEILPNTTEIGASHFMTYHTILRTSEDYTEALKWARNIADNITSTFKIYNVSDPDAAVFPYSIFYVFYEQYLTILQDTVLNISISVVAIFVVTLLLMGLDIHSSLIIVVTILMIVFDLMGLMYLWSISLNAVSLVNLVMAVGISVEFCSHITKAFVLSMHENRVARAQHALAHMGSSVLSGITLTKFGGIVVLAFSKSQIFQVFYFRMYLGIVLIGAAHGLIFLPVLLSIIGPPVKYKLRSNELICNKNERYKRLVDSNEPTN